MFSLPRLFTTQNFPHRILKVLASVSLSGYNIPAMKSASRPRPHLQCAASRRRPAKPIRDFKDYSSFEKIVFCCMAPAALIFNHLDETSMYSHDVAEKNFRLGLIYIALVEMAVGLCVGSVLWCVLKCVALALRKVQRPKYYPQERMRRQALARERRRVRRRTTLNAAPTPEALLAQWGKVKGSPEEMIRFGSMLCDLEAYVDNSLLRNENGEIVGRNPGIRGWLNANCQSLAAHYKTVMGYKAMAEKFRQAVGLADPYPAALALGDRQNTVRKTDVGGQDGERGPMARQGDGERQSTVRNATAAICGRARKVAGEMLKECRRSQRSVRIALTMRLSPNLVPMEIEQEERRRQGLPVRDGFARRFVQMMA